jgi:hypothetical protein
MVHSVDIYDGLNSIDFSVASKVHTFEPQWNPMAEALVVD